VTQEDIARLHKEESEKKTRDSAEGMFPSAQVQINPIATSLQDKKGSASDKTTSYKKQQGKKNSTAVPGAAAYSTPIGKGSTEFADDTRKGSGTPIDDKSAGAILSHGESPLEIQEKETKIRVVRYRKDRLLKVRQLEFSVINAELIDFRKFKKTLLILTKPLHSLEMKRFC
jgi:hypothetical protein